MTLEQATDSLETGFAKIVRMLCNIIQKTFTIHHFVLACNLKVKDKETVKEHSLLELFSQMSAPSI